MPSRRATNVSVDDRRNTCIWCMNVHIITTYIELVDILKNRVHNLSCPNSKKMQFDTLENSPRETLFSIPYMIEFHTDLKVIVQILYRPNLN